ncbi:hypothetical protein FRC01_004588 [Tulasnella sp. 417]|nr:hypothetical protein FRC01_004588 [Tulasnella sp. 417]
MAPQAQYPDHQPHAPHNRGYQSQPPSRGEAQNAHHGNYQDYYPYDLHHGPPTTDTRHQPPNNLPTNHQSPSNPLSRPTRTCFLPDWEDDDIDLPEDPFPPPDYSHRTPLPLPRRSGIAPRLPGLAPNLARLDSGDEHEDPIVPLNAPDKPAARPRPRPRVKPAAGTTSTQADTQAPAHTCETEPPAKPTAKKRGSAGGGGEQSKRAKATESTAELATQLPRPGRATGVRDYSNEELKNIFSIIRQVMPAGGNGWKEVEERHAPWCKRQGFDNPRNGYALKQKFRKLYLAKPPSGDPDVPWDVAEAKEIYQIILGYYGTAPTDDIDDDEEIEEVPPPSRPPATPNGPSLPAVTAARAPPGVGPFTPADAAEIQTKKLAVSHKGEDSARAVRFDVPSSTHRPRTSPDLLSSISNIFDPEKAAERTQMRYTYARLSQLEEQSNNLLDKLAESERQRTLLEAELRSHSVLHNFYGGGMSVMGGMGGMGEMGGMRISGAAYLGGMGANGFALQRRPIGGGMGPMAGWRIRALSGLDYPSNPSGYIRGLRIRIQLVRRLHPVG